jgi:hypothetical protein
VEQLFLERVGFGHVQLPGNPVAILQTTIPPVIEVLASLQLTPWEIH